MDAVFSSILLVCLISGKLRPLMLGETEGVQGWEESRVLHQDLLSPLGKKAGSEGRPQQVACCRAGDETGGLDMEESQDLKLTTCLAGLLASLAGLAGCSWRMPAGIRG